MGLDSNIGLVLVVLSILFAAVLIQGCRVDKWKERYEAKTAIAEALAQSNQALADSIAFQNKAIEAWKSFADSVADSSRARLRRASERINDLEEKNRRILDGIAADTTFTLDDLFRVR